MNIRYFESGDIDRATRLLRDMWILHVDEGGKLLNRSYIENYDVAEYILKATEDSSQQIFVAVENEHIVGIIRGEIEEYKDMHNFKKLVYIDDLAVDSSYQRIGIGDALTDKVLGWGREKGAEAAKSKVYTFNEKSQKLMEKHGFEDIYRYYYKFF